MPRYSSKKLCIQLNSVLEDLDTLYRQIGCHKPNVDTPQCRLLDGAIEKVEQYIMQDHNCYHYEMDKLPSLKKRQGAWA